MMTKENKLLDKKVDVSKTDGFHSYGFLRGIGKHIIWLEINSEASFIPFINVKEIRLDRKK